MNINLCEHIYVYLCLYAYMYVCMYVCTHVCIHCNLCRCILDVYCIRTYDAFLICVQRTNNQTNTHTDTHTDTHTHAHTHTHTHTDTHTQRHTHRCARFAAWLQLSSPAREELGWDLEKPYTWHSQSLEFWVYRV